MLTIETVVARVLQQNALRHQGMPLAERVREALNSMLRDAMDLPNGKDTTDQLHDLADNHFDELVEAASNALTSVEQPAVSEPKES